MRTTRIVAAVAALLPSSLAFCGPPFLTDDPEPTDTGHWEIYAPAFDAAGHGREFEGSAGVELNYGAARDVQVTVGLPASVLHDAGGFSAGAGDLEVSLKYRLFHDEDAGLSIAVFPGITVPTARKGYGADHVTALLPAWMQKDIGDWSLFGGGGYAINPGQGNRNYWTGGIALSRTLSERVLLGIEVDRQGKAAQDGEAETSLGVGAIVRLSEHFRLLGSAGPTRPDGGGTTAFHAFLALGWDY